MTCRYDLPLPLPLTSQGARKDPARPNRIASVPNEVGRPPAGDRLLLKGYRLSSIAL